MEREAVVKGQEKQLKGKCQNNTGKTKTISTPLIISIIFSVFHFVATKLYDKDLYLCRYGLVWFLMDEQKKRIFQL